MIRLQKVIEFAQSQGYATAKYLGRWHAFESYEPIMDPEEVSHIGLPYRILVDGDEIRMQTHEEVLSEFAVK